jgi:anti-sigma B factor antagonist
MTGPDDEAFGDPSEPSPKLAIRSRQAGRGVVWEVAGEVDLSTEEQFLTGLRHALRGKHDVLVVDLDGLTFLGSRGLNALVEVNKAAGPGVMRVVAGSRAARRAIEVTGLDNVLTIRATVEEALGADT